MLRETELYETLLMERGWFPRAVLPADGLRAAQALGDQSYETLRILIAGNGEKMSRE